MGRRVSIEIVIAMVIAAAAGSGCFRSRSASDAGVAPPSERDVAAFIDALHAELCRREVECEPRSGSESAQYHCAPDPVSRESWIQSWRAGERRYDPDAAARCLATLRAGSGCLESYSEVRDCYREPLVITRDEGDPCEHDCGPDLHCGADRCVCVRSPAVGMPCDVGACADGAWCDRETQICVPIPTVGSPCDSSSGCGPFVRYCLRGVCTDDPTLELGEPCGFEGECREGSTCDVVSGDEIVCVPLHSEGERCLLGGSCAAGLACLASICRPARAPGEPCERSADCGAGAPYCVDLRCTADVEGSACATERLDGFALVDPTAPPSCPSGFVCARDSALAVRGTCQRRRDFGEACSHAEVCPSRGRCVDGRCARVALPAEPCDASTVCPATHVCSAGSCVERPRLGERCDATTGACRDSPCVDGTCARLPIGASCESWRDCEARTCLDGACAPPASVGESCAWPVACEDGARCNFALREPTCIRRCSAL